MNQPSGMSALETLAAISRPLRDDTALTLTLVNQEVRNLNHKIHDEHKLLQRIAEVFKMAECGRGTQSSIDSNRLSKPPSVLTPAATPEPNIIPANISRPIKNPKHPTTQSLKDRMEKFTAEEKISSDPPTTIELLKLRGGMGIYWEKTMSATTMDKLRRQAFEVEMVRRMSSHESHEENTVRSDMSPEK